MKSLIIITIIAVLISSVTITSISAQSQYEIPAWVKGIAGFWAEDKITDSEFGEGLVFLIDNDIIQVPLIQELENKISQLEAENSELRSQLNVPTPEPTYPNPASYDTDVVIPRGTGVDGCEEKRYCYDPERITIQQYSTVTWYNADTAAHTVTGGSPGSTGGFDSLKLISGKSFSHKFSSSGTFNYFCMLHPWMQGVIIVEG